MSNRLREMARNALRGHVPGCTDGDTYVPREMTVAELTALLAHVEREALERNSRTWEAVLKQTRAVAKAEQREADADLCDQIAACARLHTHATVSRHLAWVIRNQEYNDSQSRKRKEKS